MDIFESLLILAAAINRTVELAVKPLLDRAGLSEDVRVFAVRLSAVILGVLMAFLYNLNALPEFIPVPTTVGVIITGAALAFGAEGLNGLRDLLYWRDKPTTPQG